MDPKIAERFNDQILHQAMSRFSIEQDKILLLDGFESFMYEFSCPDGEFILRIGHSLRRTRELILGEVDWINFLAAGGASVAKAVPSDAGRLVEFIDDGQGGYFMATAFEKALGGPPTSDLWNQDLFRAWGRLLGKIHALTKDYQPSDPAWHREAWDSPGNLLVETWLSPSETVVLSEFHKLMDHFPALPKDRDNYGLIHQDAHAGNFYVDRDYRITLFDFDDCVYSWFIYDIAMVFFYALMGRENDESHIEHFCGNFFQGYSRENTLDPNLLAEIPFFLKLREIDLYAQIIFSSGGEDKVDDPWSLRYLKGRRERIQGCIAYIDFDWSSLAKYSITG